MSIVLIACGHKPCWSAKKCGSDESSSYKKFLWFISGKAWMSGPNVMSNHLAVVKTFHWNTEMWDSSWRKRGKSEAPQSQRIHHVGTINTKFLGKPAHRNISVWTKVELANVSIVHPTSSPLVLISLSQTFFFFSPQTPHIHRLWHETSRHQMYLEIKRVPHQLLTDALCSTMQF